MDTMKQFSPKLKTLREEAGLNQSQLADKLGVSRGSISFYENGDRIPDIEFLHKVSEYFDVSADWLLGLSDVKSTDIEIKGTCNYTGLSEAAIKNIIVAKSTSQDQGTVWCNASKILSKLFEAPEIYVFIKYIFNAVYCDSKKYEIVPLLQRKEHRTQDEQDFLDMFSDMGKYIQDSGKVLLEGSEASEYFLFKAKEIMDNMVNDVFQLFVKDIETILLPHIPQDTPAPHSDGSAQEDK